MIALPAGAVTQLQSAPSSGQDRPSVVDRQGPRDRKVIGTAELARTRATLTAIRTGRYSATVRLRAEVQRADGWKTVDSVRVGKREGWFWFVVSRARGVCTFSIGEHQRRTFDVRLTASTSIGCDVRTHHYVLKRGELVRR